MTKQELARSIKVPHAIEHDKHEYMTQEEFTRGLVAAIDKLCLSMSELEAIRDGNITVNELRAIINLGLHN